jgi:hypothetical protein
MVARQLGYDPFEDASPITIEASIERLGTRLRGKVLVRREGAPSAERVVDGSSDCANVANALALTLALALDTIESSPELPPLPPPPLPPAPAVEVPAPRAPRPLPRAAAVALQFTVSPLVSSGIAPDVAPGGAIGAGVRWPYASVAIEGRFDVPASASLTSGGTVRTQLSLVSAAPCLHLNAFVGCAVAGVGSFAGASEGVAHPVADSGMLVVTGLRIGAEWPISRVVAVRPYVDGLVALSRPSLWYNDKPIWKLPAWSGSLGVAVVFFMGRSGF